MTLQRINNARGHWYKLDGTKVDGVTTLIEDGMRKKALEAWGIRSVAEYAADHLDRLIEMQPMGRDAIVAALKQSPYTVRDKAASRGTQVHRLAEALIHGREVDVPEELAGHVESYVRFLDEWQPTEVLVEAVVGSRQWRYAGTLDTVYDLPDGRRVIADLKTARHGIYPETVLQLAAYRYAEFYMDGTSEKPMSDVQITHAQGIWVRADGYDVFDLPADERAHKDFLHVAWSARWAARSRDLVGTPVPPPREAVA